MVGRTPGPWHVEHIEGHGYYVCHPETVCDATTVCKVGRGDAHLIAAAPTLLAILSELRTELDAIDEAHWTQRIFELVEEADELIPEARGEK